MHKDLERINGKNFQTFIGENFPLYSDLDIGQMIIVDNTASENIDGLVPNSYNLFIDHIHIASGYGFSSIDDFNYNINTVDWCKNQIDLINEYNENVESQSLFNFYTNEFNDSNHFSTYNSYGFETSFIKLSIDSPSSDQYKYNYRLNINKYDLTYLSPIEVKYTKNGTEDITSILTEERFPINIKLNKYIPLNNDHQYNGAIAFENVKLNGINIGELSGSTIGSDGFSTYYFDQTDQLFDKDLVVEYTFNGAILSTYTMPNLLKWHEEMIIYPTTNLLESLNILDEIIDNNGDIDDDGNRSLVNLLESNSKIIIHPNDTLDIEFCCGETFMHDYIITKSSNNIEFYYNGIKSNNWSIKTLEIKDTTKNPIKNYGIFNIYRSPQKYCGAHTWQIKIKTMIDNGNS